jgi:hypothetical protein
MFEGQSVRILSNVSKASINGIFLAPLIISLLICLLQQFLSIRETKKHLLQLYKGECEYVKKLKNLDNSSISESSFHFGGYQSTNSKKPTGLIILNKNSFFLTTASSLAT